MDALTRTAPEPRISPTVLQRIGRTRLLTVNRILPEGCARILIKELRSLTLRQRMAQFCGVSVNVSHGKRQN
jgi:hypothetical protein